MSNEPVLDPKQKGTLLWRTVVTAALVALATVVGALAEREPVGVAACVEVLLKGLSYKSSAVPVVPFL